MKHVLERDEPGRVWPAASTIREIVKRAGLVVARKSGACRCSWLLKCLAKAHPFRYSVEMKQLLLSVLLSLCFVGCGNSLTPITTSDKVSFMGDSISYFWQTDSTWPTNSRWSNVAQPKMTTRWMVQNLKSLSLSERPNVLHILGGTNDVHQQLSLSESVSNLSAMISAARSARIPVLLGTIPPWGNGDSNTECTSPTCYEDIDALNAWIRAQEGSGVIVVDYHTALSTDGKHYATGLSCDLDNPCKFTNYGWPVADGIHPNAAGYRIMMKSLQSARFRHSN